MSAELVMPRLNSETLCIHIVRTPVPRTLQNIDLHELHRLYQSFI